MKRFAFAAAMVFVVAFAQVSAARAADYYVGTSPATGMDCYLMTDSIYKLWTTENGRGFAARLKMVGRTIQYLDYEVGILKRGVYTFKNSAGYSGEATPHDTPIEWNICRYIAKNYF